MSVVEFTGERYVPGTGGFQIAYEHLHRYLFAARWAAGKSVLDVGTGVGYGASMLAQVAQCVCAVDRDASSLRYARETFGRDNLFFIQADASHLPFRSRSFDVVAALEVLEHVTEQEGLVRELARVARPGGAVLISTPNRATYSDARDYSNPYHVREFYRDEFLLLLKKHFRHFSLSSTGRDR